MAKINTKIRPKNIFQPFMEVRQITDTVIVPVSLGYDSAVVLDFSCRIFKKVYTFFGYLVKGLEHQESILRQYEKRYGIEIVRIPNHTLSYAISKGLYRIERPFTKPVKFENTLALGRQKLGFRQGEGWILVGFKASDGPHRYMSLNQYGYIRHEHKKAYPIVYFKKKDVRDYVAKHEVPIQPYSFELTRPKNFYDVKTKFPEDWPKVLKEFPFAEAAVIRHKQLEEQKEARKRARHQKITEDA